MFSKLKNNLQKIPALACLLLAGDTSPFSSELDTRQADMVRAFNETSGFSVQDLALSNMLQRILMAFMSILGLIFIILIVYGGYQWLTAKGNEQQASKAKETITHAIWGIIITVSAYTIAYFVLSFVMSGGLEAI